MLNKLADKEESTVAKKKTKPEPEKTSRPITGKAPRLSYNQQRLLEVLPQEIEKLEQDIAQTEEKLSDSDLYTRNPTEFSRLSDLLLNLQQQKDEKETTWLEIQLLKESIS